MKKSTVNNILATLNGHEAIKELNTYHKELYHARALVRSIVYRTDVDDEKAAELVTALAGVKVGGIVKNYAMLMQKLDGRKFSAKDEKQINAAMKKLYSYVVSVKNNAGSVISKICSILHKQKTATIDALVAEIDSFKDNFKLATVREKFAAVNALIDAAEEVTEETQTNAPEAPEMPLTASSDVQMSNVSTDAKEHGEDAKNAPETQFEHTDLLADDTARNTMGDLQKVA